MTLCLSWRCGWAGSRVATKALILSHGIAASWPENIAVSRFCCRLMRHVEATIGAFIDAAAHRNRAGIEGALTGFVRPKRNHRLWGGALALVAAEMRAV